DQMARSRARSTGQIRPVSALPLGRTIINIWSNLNEAYFRDRTLGGVAMNKRLSRRAWLTAAGLGLASAVARAQGGADDGAALSSPVMPYTAFDKLPFEAVPVEGGRLRLVFGPGQPVLLRERILAYVRQSARAVATYFGRFPAADTRVLV